MEKKWSQATYFTLIELGLTSNRTPATTLVCMGSLHGSNRCKLPMHTDTTGTTGSSDSSSSSTSSSSTSWYYVVLIQPYKLYRPENFFSVTRCMRALVGEPTTKY
jgi:hypothetical protein